MAWRVARAQITAEQVDDGEWSVTIEGFCTFLALPRLHHVLESIPPGHGSGC